MQIIDDTSGKKKPIHIVEEGADELREQSKEIKKEQEEFDKLPDKAKEEIKDKQATIERQLHTIDLQNQRNEEYKVILFIAAVFIVVLLIAFADF